MAPRSQWRSGVEITHVWRQITLLFDVLDIDPPDGPHLAGAAASDAAADPYDARIAAASMPHSAGSSSSSLSSSAAAPNHHQYPRHAGGVHRSRSRSPSSPPVATRHATSATPTAPQVGVGGRAMPL